MPGPALMDLTMEEPSLGSKWLLEPEALLFKSLLDISIQGFRRKDLTLPNPCSHGFCFPDRKPQLSCGRPRAQLQWSFPWSQYRGCCWEYIGCHPQLTWQDTGLPNPPGTERKEAWGGKVKKVFVFLAFLAGKPLRKLLTLLFPCTGLLLFQHKSRRLCQPIHQLSRAEDLWETWKPLNKLGMLMTGSKYTPRLGHFLPGPPPSLKGYGTLLQREVFFKHMWVCVPVHVFMGSKERTQPKPRGISKGSESFPENHFPL